MNDTTELIYLRLELAEDVVERVAERLRDAAATLLALAEELELALLGDVAELAERLDRLAASGLLAAAHDATTLRLNEVLACEATGSVLGRAVVDLRLRADGGDLGTTRHVLESGGRATGHLEVGEGRGRGRATVLAAVAACVAARLAVAARVDHSTKNAQKLESHRKSWGFTLINSPNEIIHLTRFLDSCKMDQEITGQPLACATVPTELCIETVGLHCDFNMGIVFGRLRHQLTDRCILPPDVLDAVGTIPNTLKEVSQPGAGTQNHISSVDVLTTVLGQEQVLIGR